ncbi:PspC domain-containing protein [Gallaecimonas sp. GXIMD4217]|uniref:PspC domain-containing protein n=1 Tax=Gallaecimonas sp. GXIMD4217 TaxID=3131927 RepID=UPI00311AF95C
MRDGWYLDKEDNMLFGVCSGLAKKLDIDRAWVRLATFVALLISPFTTGVLYLLAAWLLPAKRPLVEKEYRWDRKY